MSEVTIATSAGAGYSLSQSAPTVPWFSVLLGLHLSGVGSPAVFLRLRRPGRGRPGVRHAAGPALLRSVGTPAPRPAVSRCSFVWGHGLNSSMAHEDDLGLFDWSPCADVARVVRYDARGHGESSSLQYEDRAYRWSALVDDMLRAVPEGPIVAGGASMGAVTAVYAAARAPRRVQALVLATPPAAWEARAPHSEFYRSGARLVEARGVRELVTALRAQPQPRIFEEELPEAQEVWLRHLEQMDERVLPAILRGAAGSDLPSRDEVRAIVVPTLILAWEGDPTHPVSTAEALHELIVLSELHVARDLSSIRAWPYVVRDFLSGLCSWE